jgi:hypothetical protein
MANLEEGLMVLSCSSGMIHEHALLHHHTHRITRAMLISGDGNGSEENIY